MPLFKLKLKKFQFPGDLPNGNANFRFIVALRFINDKGQPTVEHAVMPSLDTFWECDTDKDEEPNYVRHNTDNQFDMKKIDDWDKLIFFVKGTTLHSIQFKVFDVDRKDIWDKAKDVAVKGSIKFVSDVIPKVGITASIDLASSLLKQFAGGGDKVLFSGSTKLKASDDKNPVQFTVRGSGSKGDYKIVFNVKKIPTGQ